MNITTLILSISFSLITLFSYSQKRGKEIKLVNANTLEYDNSRGQAKRLIGDVILKHEKATMYCDSAYLYSDINTLHAFGHIKIKKGAKMTIYGDSLRYDGNTRIAHLRNNVKMVDKEMTLTTNFLDYNVATDYAMYIGGGKIVYTKDQNTLTSKKGYFKGNNEFIFDDNVVITNPDYQIFSDSLKYITKTEVSFFYGPTVIRSESKTIYCERGWYNTSRNTALFKQRAVMIDGANQLRGDSIFYDNEKQIGRAFGNVSLIDTTQKIIINADYALHNEKDSNSLFTGNTLFTQLYDKDSLFLHADTLFAAYDNLTKKQVLYAFHKVRFYKADLQGQCDSLIYSQADSSIQLFIEPVLWADENQMTADVIIIKTFDGKIQSLIMQKNSFIISEEDSIRYNQIKGKDMFGVFRDNELAQINVIGNGQTIYYAREDDSTYIGMNKAECSDLTVFIKDNVVDKITFINRPVATLFPLSEVNPADMTLRGFIWRGNIRPKRKEDIFFWEK